MKEDMTYSQLKQLAVILFFYGICAAIFGYAYRYGINPDGLSHLRLAGYIAEGKFHQSVSAAWSPMFSWTVAPFLLLGIDELTSARLTIALSGAVLVIASWLLSKRFELSAFLRFSAVLVIALLVSDWSIQFITADVLIAAFLVFYLYVVTSSDILATRNAALSAGIVAGLAYYAKNYMLPFFIVHFPVVLFVRYYLEKDNSRISLKRLFLFMIGGMSIFAVVISAWVFILSAQYGRFTMTGKGKIAYALMGPEDVRHPPLFYDGLHAMNNDYAVHVFEDHSQLKYETWSPFENKKYFIHQLKLIKNNLIYLFNHFVNRSPFFTYAFIIGIFTLVPLALLSGTLTRSNKFLYLWSAVTFIIYSSGYVLLIARSPRRFYGLMVVFVLLAFHFCGNFTSRFATLLGERNKKIVTFYLLVLLIGAFSLKPAIHLFDSLGNIMNKQQINAYKDIADQISKVNFPAPYAIVRSAQKPYTDYYIAFYLKKQFTGRPLASDLEGISKELKLVDAKSLLVFDNSELVERARNDIRYGHLAEIILKKEQRYMNAVNIKQDLIKEWDRKVNIFTVN